MGKLKEFKLPSGRVIKMRPATGLDEYRALRKLLDRPEAERERLMPLEIAAYCIEVDGKTLSGHEELLTWETRDLTAILTIYNELNSLKASDIAALRAQLGDNSAILEMLFLIKNLNMTYKEASELDVKERKMLVAAVAKYLGLESPQSGS